MIRFVLLALAFCLAQALSASAERVAVIAGEHADFTRIVVQLQQPSGWRFGRVDGGYGLTLLRGDIALDTSRAFDIIPRTRLTALEPAADGVGLILKTQCDCHARLIEDRPGLLVIDLRDGPPPPNSAFEARLDEPAPPSRRAARAVSQLSPEQVAQLGYFWGDLAQLAASEATASPSGFDITRDYSLPPKEAVGEPVDITRDYTGQPAGPAPALLDPTASDREEPSAVPAKPAITADNSAESVRTAAGGPPAAPRLPQPVTAAAPSAPAPTLDRATAPDLPMLPLVLDPALSRTARTDDPTFSLRAESPRVDAARDALLVQLSRAASQGLVEVVQPEKPLLPSEKLARSAGPAEARPVPPPLPELASARDHLTIKAQTSIDRDSLARINQRPTTPDGVTCLPDGKFDVAAWGDDRPLAEQLTERRQALVGEFDAPSSEAIAELAKLYLYFGFGAEARDALRAFGVSVRDSDLLLVMAHSMDHGSAPEIGRLKGMADCDTSAALWSVLADAGLTSGDPVNVAAVVRGFSALPLGLRRLIGPVLSERFLNIGNESAARTLRDAVTRASGDPGAETRLVNARLDLALDRTREAEATMADIVAEDGSASPKALILLIDTQIKNGVTVDQKTVDTAAALAFEHRGTDMGAQLARAEVLAKAASDDFDEAFATLDRQTREGPRAMPTALDVDLFTLLHARADDATFLRHVFGATARLTGAELPRAVRQALAQRLVTLGFPQEARQVLAAAARPKPADRLILARIALASQDPGTALRQISGIDGQEAARIEARAMQQLGYHAQAAEALERADQPEAIASAAWRAGDAAAVLKHGTPEQQAALNALLTAPSVPEPGLETAPDVAGQTISGTAPPILEPFGPLARNRALLAQSQKMRDDLSALLNAYPGPIDTP